MRNHGGRPLTAVDYGQAHADGYAAGHADGYAEGRRESDLTGHLLRPHAAHLLDMLSGDYCPKCNAIREVLGELLP